MTVDLNNESGLEADSSGLIRLATYALGQLRIHPQAELSILLVDEPTMSAYHEKYLGEPGPTDVLSFPMDELRPPNDDEDPPAGLLGDIVLCPAVTGAAGPASTADRPTPRRNTCWCTACCTFSATTTPTRTRRRRCSTSRTRSSRAGPPPARIASSRP